MFNTFKKSKLHKIIVNVSSSHPIVAFACMCVGMPAAIIAIVTLITTLITYPIFLIGGWL